MPGVVKAAVETLVGRDRALRIRAAIKKDFPLAGFAMKRILKRNPKSIWPQKVLEFESRIPLNPQTLVEDLAQRDFCVHSGAHASYIHEPSDMVKLCPELLERYPRPFGLKIMKSRSPASDGSVYYTSTKTSIYTTPLAMRIVGSLREKVAVGNILALHGLTPRIYDLIELTHPTSKPLMALVVEHVGHETETGDKAGKFMERMQRVARQEGILLADRKNSRDLRPPTFNGNVLKGEEGPVFVDIQKLVQLESNRHTKENSVEAAAKHLWDRSMYRGGLEANVRNLGRERKSEQYLKASSIEALLKSAGFEIEDSRILEFGCGRGELMAYFLWRGAGHCIGIGNAATADAIRKALYYFGYSRFEIIDRDDEDPGLCQQKALRRPIDLVIAAADDFESGALDGLKSLEWSYLLIESESGESSGDLIRRVSDYFVGVDIVSSEWQDRSKDGGSSRRLVLFRSAGDQQRSTVRETKLSVN